MTDTTHTEPPTDPTPAEAEPVEAEPADQVEVRRNVVLSTVLGLGAAGLTTAFAVRAFGGAAEPLDWALLAVLGVVTVLHVAALIDARAPLLVADRMGVRLREGADWQGIAWDEIECMEHLPRRMPLHDGHLLVVGETGQQLIVPLTMATRVVGAEPGAVSDQLADLAAGRADVVEVVPGIEEPDDPMDDADAGYAEPDEATARPSFPPNPVRPERRGIAAEVEKRYRSPLAEPTVETNAAPPSPDRPLASTTRVDVQRPWFLRGFRDDGGGPHPTIGANALLVEPDPAVDPEIEQDQLEHTLTVVLDDLAVHPAAEPVIGPQLEAARERLRLTIDQLSERTRIRPHVIEAMEVDDFGPCGGDFYARGHVRTLARVLGVDAAPLVATYDETYADAPVDPRRVFESELATGVGGSIRGTRGGRNWSVLIAAIMAAVLIWSIARLVMDGPVPIGEPSTLRQTGSNGIGGGARPEAVPVTLTAAGGGARVIVRDGSGTTVFDDPLAFGQTMKLEVVPPVRIWSSDGSVTASVDCKDPLPLGETGTEASKALPAC